MFWYMIQPDISPIILEIIGPIAIRWYSLMYIVAFGGAYFFWMKQIELKKITLTKLQFSDLLFYIFLFMLLGARVGYILVYQWEAFIQNPMMMFYVWEGGLSFHGGFVGLLFGGYYTIKKDKLKLNWVDLMDLAAISAPFGIACVRIGNFINGELWGRPTTSFIGMIFPRRVEYNQSGGQLLPIDVPIVQDLIQNFNYKLISGFNYFSIGGQELVNVPRFPSQLLESLTEGVLLFTILMVLYCKLGNKRYQGLFGAIFLMGYGATRIFCEFFRQPDEQIGFLFENWLTMGMLLSLPMFLAGLIWICFIVKNKKKSNLWVLSKD